MPGLFGVIVRHCIVVGVLLAVVQSTRAAAPTPEQIDTSIRKAVDFLYAQQKPDGRWETDPTRIGGDEDANQDFGKMQGTTWGGYSALATYALLAAGEKPSDPRIQRAVEFLKKADITGIYAIGVRAQVWTLIPQDDSVRNAAKRDAKLLQIGMNTKPDARGLYHYITVPNGNWDLSVSQYAVLGMWACQRVAVEVPDPYWQAVDAAWKKQQNRDGGWAYDLYKPERTCSMTAAGIATLYITQDELQTGEPGCKGNLTNANIDHGMKWLGDNFSKILRDDYYTWYGVERIGAASGLKYLGTVDWFADGAAKMVQDQQPDGGYNAYYGGRLGGTSFALIFLSRGRASVCFNKLAYAAEALKPGASGAAVYNGRWNQRPRDLANLVRWSGKQAERFYNWQIVNLDMPVRDLHDAPILYISGDQKLNLSAEAVAKLKQYVEEGGLIFASSDCNSDAFAKSAVELGKRMFPDYEPHALPADHPIYTRQPFKLTANRKPANLKGISNGSRELMLILSSGDVSRAWHRDDTRAKAEQFELGADLFQYAVDQASTYRGETSLVDRAEGPAAERSLKVARLRYPGNWDPEPYGWRRLANVLHNEKQVEMTVEGVGLGEGKLTGYGMAHLTGSGPLKLTETQSAELKAFVEKGGLLVIDAVGGDRAFADSSQELVRNLFGDAGKLGLNAPLAADDPLYRSTGTPIEKFTYRNFAKQLGNAPRVLGVRVGDRWGVLISPEDLSTGLMGHSVDGVLGYSPATATAIMQNIARYAADKK